MFENIVKPALRAQFLDNFHLQRWTEPECCKLVQHATSGTTKISYSAAKALIAQSNAVQDPVGLLKADLSSLDLIGITLTHPHTMLLMVAWCGKIVLEKMVETIVNEESPNSWNRI